MIAPDYALPATRDMRPQRGNWAPGLYLCNCHKCEQQFTGDKGATVCAVCAYAEDDAVYNPAPHAAPPTAPTKGFSVTISSATVSDFERGRQAGLIEARSEIDLLRSQLRITVEALESIQKRSVEFGEQFAAAIRARAQKEPS